MGRIIHFDLEAQDPDRAMRFYTDVFNWQFEKWDGPLEYWLIKTGPEEEPGIDGGMSRTEGDKPETTNTIAVENLDMVLERLRLSGGHIVREKSAIPGVGWIAYCTDTEGNYFGVIENDAEAK
ncbi:MAG: VOC family protein [Lentisphaeria bacterium]|nr:VOC family protein [Candidatus Neomarinimicrobiota bacterium]MCF7843163.1 VOC family protein [Lentisphaeria bacterium]